MKVCFALVYRVCFAAYAPFLKKIESDFIAEIVGDGFQKHIPYKLKNTEKWKNKGKEVFYFKAGVKIRMQT